MNKIYKLLDSRLAFPKVCSIRHKLVSTNVLWKTKVMPKSVCSRMMHPQCLLVSLIQFSMWLYCCVTNNPKILWPQMMVNICCLIGSVFQKQLDWLVWLVVSLARESVLAILVGGAGLWSLGWGWKVCFQDGSSLMWLADYCRLLGGRALFHASVGLPLGCLCGGLPPE